MTSPTTTGRPGTGNIIATVIFFVLLAGAAFLAVVLSGFFVMATDSCGTTGTTCNTDFVAYALIVVWGGVVVALVGATVGTLVSGLRHRTTWWWPLLGVLVVLVTFVGGLVLVGQMGTAAT
jgi:hypothetical protein